jgi:uncharacterized protein
MILNKIASGLSGHLRVKLINDFLIVLFMITRCFTFLDGISNRKQDIILNQASDWNGFLEVDVKGISKLRKFFYNQKVREARQALLNDDVVFFNKYFKNKDLLHLYDYYEDETCFLDVEINRGREDLILVGVYDGFETKQFLKGYNLDKKTLFDYLSRFKVIVTYNGSSFDVPLLKKYFDSKLNFIHLDLKPLCLSVDLKGGLKEVEKQLGLNRDLCYSVKPGDPCKIYRAFLVTGDRYYLDLLLNYNEEDCLSLKRIIEFIKKEKKRSN